MSGIAARDEVALELLDTTVGVETPERVQFKYQLAGPGRRAVAWLIDLAIRLVVYFVAFVAVVLVAASAVEFLQGLGVGFFLLLLFFGEWFTGAIFETVLQGRTPGKWVMSLRVVRDDGSPARFPDYLLRNLIKAVDFLPLFYVVPTFGVALVAMLLDKKFRRIGDMVAGTVVVVEERGQMLAQVAIEPPVTEEERLDLPVRVDLSRDEIRVIEDFLRRRKRLSNERAEELAQLFADTISERTGIHAKSKERVLVLAYARATGKDR